MKQKMLITLTIVLSCISICAILQNNIFAFTVAVFVCALNIFCYYKWVCTRRIYKPYWDDSQWDATDAAHPAWWRGETWSAYKAAELIGNILSGKDTGRGVMNEPLETMRRSVMDLKKGQDNLQKRNDNQAETIHSYQTDNETKKLLIQINELFIKIGTLEKENRNCWGRIHDLEEENGKYWEMIGDLETAKAIAVEQRTADWQRIHDQENEVDNLKDEILTLKSRNDE